MGKNSGKFSSWKVQRRTYQERGQLASRAHLGPLEKRSDYKVRSRKQHQAEEKDRYMQSLVRAKNPDEYNLDMAHAHQTQKGITVVHKLPKVKLLPHEEVEAEENTVLRKPQFFLEKISKRKNRMVKKNASSNLNLLRTKLSTVRRKIEKIREEMHFIDMAALESGSSGSATAGGDGGVGSSAQHRKDNDDEHCGEEAPDMQKEMDDLMEDNEFAENVFEYLDDDDDGNGDKKDNHNDLFAHGSGSGGINVGNDNSQGGRKHTVFVDSNEDMDTFDPQKYFDTHPLLAGRVFNRMRNETLLNTTLDPVQTLAAERKIRSSQKAQLKKLRNYLGQEKLLARAIHDVNIGISLATDQDNIEHIERDEKVRNNLSYDYKDVKSVKYKTERKK